MDHEATESPIRFDDDTVAPSSAVEHGSKQGPGLLPGKTIGRFLLLNRLGAGGMGEVWAAYDPELDRRVAVKVLLPGNGGSADSSASARLVREAKAMARLTHPNVITVYEAGIESDRVFIAMEYVAGRTLGKHIEHESCGWRDVVELMVQAGRGLQAAHDAGMVHRDFKPDNVMVAEDGRVLVMDFGLARPGEQTSVSREQLLGLGHDLAASDDLTLAGSVAGTPGYMPLEQFEGRELDHRADQFAWSVTAWQMLFRERPYAGRTMAEMVGALTRGERRPVPWAPQVPAWLVATLERGFAVQVENRWPDMMTLLETIVQAEGHRRRRIRRAVSVATTCALGVVLGGVAWERSARAATCEASGQAAQRAWASRAASIEQAFMETGPTFGAQSYDRVEQFVLDWAQAWGTTRAETCSTHEFTMAGTVADYTRITRCLENDLSNVEFRLDRMKQGDQTTVASAVEAVSRLPTPTRCADPVYLASRSGFEGGALDANLEVSRDLARAEALFELGALEAAHSEVRSLHEGLPPDTPAALAAEVLVLRGYAEQKVGDPEKGKAYLRDGFFAAVQAGHDEAALRAATDLVALVGVRIGDAERAAEWDRHAWAILGRVESLHAGGEARLGLLANSAQFESRRGDVVAARAKLEEARRGAVETFGADHPRTVAIEGDLALAMLTAGETAEALRRLEALVERYERAFGPGHPEVAAHLNNLGKARLDAGDWPGAERAILDALEISEAVYGSNSDAIVVDLNNLAVILDNQGKGLEAVAVYRRVVRILESSEQDGILPNALLNLAVALIDLERLDEADEILATAMVAIEHLGLSVTKIEQLLYWHTRGSLERTRGRSALAVEYETRASALAAEILGEDHHLYALTRYSIGRHLVVGDELDAARGEFEVAGRVWGVLDHPRAPLAEFGLGLIALERGELDEAVALLTRASDALAKAERPAYEIAEVELFLARALAAADRTDEASATRDSAQARLAGHTGSVRLRRELRELPALP